MTLSSGTAAQLLGLGIPAEQHNYDALARMIPPFDGLDKLKDLESLAETVVYLGHHQILPVETNSWKSLPWGTHACLFYKLSKEITDPVKNFFREGLLNNERCIWIVSHSYEWEKAVKLQMELLAETGLGESAFELIPHEGWYVNSLGRFRTTNEIVQRWLHKIEKAVMENFKGIRVSGDAHCHPDELKKFFEYENTVNESIGSLRIKALCTYCIPKFGADQITNILSTHQSVFGDFAIVGK